MLQKIVSVLLDMLLNTLGSDGILLACCGAFTCLVLCMACYLSFTRHEVESSGFHFFASATLFVICHY